MSRAQPARGDPRPVTVVPAITIGLVSLVAACGFAARPLDAHQAAGVFPPWWSREQVMDAASRAGPVSAAGRSPFVLVVHSSDGDVAARLRRAGALFVLDPGLARACGA
jgi:hypothetical protein